MRNSKAWDILRIYSQPSTRELRLWHPEHRTWSPEMRMWRMTCSTRESVLGAAYQTGRGRWSHTTCALAGTTRQTPNAAFGGPSTVFGVPRTPWRLDDRHRVAVGVEPVPLRQRGLVRLHREFIPGERRHEHQQRRAGEMKVGEQLVHHPE